jgi:hypothetical protein
LSLSAPFLRGQEALLPEEEGPKTPVTDKEFHLPVSAEESAEIQELIGRLGAPAFADRTNAAERLIEKGLRTVAQLRATYHQTVELEVKLQIERIVLAVYLDEYVYGRSGFLGITQRRTPLPTNADDPRILEGHIGIIVDKVHPDTAAYRGGLGDGDIIVEIDGEPIKTSANPTEAFGDLIRRRGPGGKIVLRVLREGGERTAEVTTMPAGNGRAGSDSSRHQAAL